MEFINFLNNSILHKNSIVCCGLDPDITKFPNEVRRFPIKRSITQFLMKVIDVTHRNVAAYKIQKAFFDMHPFGYEVLCDVIEYIRIVDRSIPVILDSKVGDIENTMEAYFEAAFLKFQVDAITVNPYMGPDVWIPLRKYSDKAGLVLVKTSNQSSRVIQDSPLIDGRPFWQHVLDLIIKEWSKECCLLPVLSGHTHSDLEGIRLILPDGMPVFFAGAGAQGANMGNIRFLLDSKGQGVLVNSSRGLLYPYEINDVHWLEKIQKTTECFKEKLNRYRK